MWFPAWPLRRPDAPRDEPCQAVGDDEIVVAVNERAIAAGLRAGMHRREAEGICPAVITVRRDPAREMVLFDPVVAAVEAVVPRVEVADPGIMLVPLSGAVRYYGGEAAIVDRVIEVLDATAGPGHRVGVATGPFAARKAAELASPAAPYLVEDDAAFLAGLDVADLGVEELVATFRWLGIRTLGELADLPRPVVVSRFGRPGLEAHRVASGEDRDPVPRALAEDRSVEERFDPPLDDMERAAFAGRALAHRMFAGLEGVAPFRIVVEMEDGAGALRTRTWRSLDPFDERMVAERIRWQLRAWIEGRGAGIGGGIAAVRIRPFALSSGGRQLGLLDGHRGSVEAQRALGEVQAIVGPDRVLQARPQGGRDPGERVRWRRWGEADIGDERDSGAPWPGRIPAPSPAMVPPQPEAVEIEWDGGLPCRIRLGSRWEPVRSWAGPWRRMGRWWDGEPVSDRYQIVTSAGAFLCEVVDGRAALIGVYD